MKELSIEEKAKRYDEAVINGSRLCECGNITRENYEYIFPELTESKDEKIKKSLIILLQHFCKGYRVPGLDFPVSYKDMLTWLEKQGEKSIGEPYEWDDEKKYSYPSCVMSKQESEDKKIRKEIINFLKYYPNIIVKKERRNDWIAWLEKQAQKLYVNDNAKEMFIKALESVEEQNIKGYKLTYSDKNSWWEDFKTHCGLVETQQIDWSEEDEFVLNDIIHVFNLNKEEMDPNVVEQYEKFIKKLTSLRLQSQWKPSYEQITALETTLYSNMSRNDERYSILSEFVAELKKLKDE